MSVEHRAVALETPAPRAHLLDQLHRGDVAQVDRRRVQAGMAQLLLDERDRDPLDGELRRTGVAQAVGMHPLLNAGLAREAGEERPDIAGLQGPAVQGAEDGAGAMEAEPPPFIEPPSDECEGGGIHADGAVAIPLAMADGQGARGSMQIAQLEGERLGNAQASPVEDSEEGTVANAGRSAW